MVADYFCMFLLWTCYINMCHVAITINIIYVINCFAKCKFIWLMLVGCYIALLLACYIFMKI